MNLTIDKLRPIEINLLQIHAAEDKRRSRLLPALLLLVAAAGALATGWLWLDAKDGLAEANRSLGAVNDELAAAQSKLSGSPNTGSIAEFLALPGQVRETRPNAALVLDKLAALVPLDCNLGTIAFDDNQAVKVTGVFGTTESIISFMQALKAAEEFTFAGMSGITKIKPDNRQVPGSPAQPLPALQVSFDLKYNANPQKKG